MSYAKAMVVTVAVVLGVAESAWAWEYSHGYYEGAHWTDASAWVPLDGAPVGVPDGNDTANIYYGVNLPDSRGITPAEIEVGTLNMDTYITWGPAPPIELWASHLTILNGGTWQWGGFQDYHGNRGQVTVYGTMTLVDDITDHYNNGTGTIDPISHSLQWGVTLTNHGIIQHTGVGYLTLGANSCQYINHGTHEFTGDGDIATIGHGGERTTNYGLIVKSGGTGESYINGELVNAGTVEARTGQLTVGNSLDYDGSTSHSLNGGKWVVQDGASIVFTARGEQYAIAEPAHVVLNGANANLYTTQTFAYTPIESLLDTVAGTLEVYGDRTFNQALALTGSLIVGDGTTLTADITNGGNMHVGNSPGIGIIDGDFNQDANGVLHIELGGTTPGSEHDQLNVIVNAALGGTLDVSYWDGFAASVGDTFTILTTNELTGQFVDVIWPDRQVWSINYDRDAATVSLTLVDVPEPHWFGLALLGIVAMRRRRN